MRVTLLLFLALCVYLTEAGSGERWDEGKSAYYKKDKYNKYDKYNKQDKYNKYEKYDKYEKYNKYNKFNDDRSDRDDSDESHEVDSRENFSPHYEDRYGKKNFYEKEYNHYKYNKYYDEDEDRRRDYKENKHHKKEKYSKKDKYHKDQKRDYEYQPEHGIFDEAIQFSKRRLFSVPEDDVDSFFDDVKQYNQKQQQQQAPKYEHHVGRYQQTQNRPQHSTYIHDSEESRQWREPEKPYHQYEEKFESSEKYPGGEGIYKEPVLKYKWKHDIEHFPRMKPIIVAPPEKRYKDFSANGERLSGPPSPTEAAKMARYIVHHADWATVATISTLPHIKGFPYADVMSVSDGPIEKGSGIPYLYMTELDTIPHDLAVNRKCSLSISLAETDYCKQKNFDPEDPRCAHVVLTGEMWKLTNGTLTAKLAEEALFPRHPIMKSWPKDHNFFFATLKIEHILLMDFFGGPKFIDVKDYLRADPPSSA